MSIVTAKIGIRLEVLTPVHVWSGESLTYGIDYCISDGELIYLEPLKLLEKYPKKTFFCDTSEVLKREKPYIKNIAKIYGSVSHRPSELKRHIMITLQNNRTLRVIPPSTVKGLIRTAFLYHFLKQDEKWRNAIVRGIERELSLLDQIRDTRELRREIKKLSNKTVENIVRFDIVEDRYRYTLDAFNRLIIQLIDVENYAEGTRLVHIKQIRDTELSSSIPPILLETIEPQTIFRYILLFQKTHDFHVTRKYLKDITWKYGFITPSNVVDSVIEFSKDTINYELSRISGISELYHYRETLQGFLSDMKGNNDVAYVRIGAYTGHKFKTINLLLPDRISKKLSRIMQRVYGHLWDDKTVKVTEYNGDLVGFGWVRMRFLT